ncbi:unnamed protein product [Dovyalis caffra]|uniref:Amidase domain-containing protein n=1 Tax=Dovyalis caffra TaxID=77055 RepID=A0AAV1RAI4_9ROSI|nr:unnamed protein product [Dovyalis caffra]
MEINPGALFQADRADYERRVKAPGSLVGLHGIPILPKDNIATKDKLNTSSGSFALLGSVVPRDAGVVVKLRKAEAIIFGKASLSEWSAFMLVRTPGGFSARGGQGKVVYVNLQNLVILAIFDRINAHWTARTETDGSILCPSNANLVVGGLKTTVDLTSRAGVIPISARQDTVGTVLDAVYVLDAIVGIDYHDGATQEAAKYIPHGGYKQFLKRHGFEGKRLGIVRTPFLSSASESESQAFEHHLRTLWQGGAVLVDHLEIANMDTISTGTAEGTALLAELKISLNAYLKELVASPVRTLADLIAYDQKFSDTLREKIKAFGQDLFLAAQATNGIGTIEKAALPSSEKLTGDGFQKLMCDYNLDALVTPGAGIASVLAIEGLLGINVPVGYDGMGVPFGINFGGLKGTEPKMIEIAFGIEQATKKESLQPLKLHKNDPLKFNSSMSTNSLLLFVLGFLQLSGLYTKTSGAFSIEEATIDDLQLAFKQNQLTSRRLVAFYLKRIRRLNPLLKGVIEVNPDALFLADKADRERKANTPGSSVGLHGIPILLKDNIATKDKLNTTAGSYALLGSVVPRDAGVVVKLRKAGAIILGKASLSEWANFRTNGAPSGFCGRSGRGKNPYVLSATPCGSSSGSGISVAANLAAVSLGSETDGSILCPSSYNSVVGIKPTVGLTSRAGVIPITPRQDTVGPICRTVSDAVYVLDAIVGFDSNDVATREAAKYIPHGGCRQFLDPLGLKGKRLGIVRDPFYNFSNVEGSGLINQTFEHHFQTLRREGAVLIDNLQISDVDTITNIEQSGELLAMLLEFKPALNKYLEQLVASPVRSLADVIAFNKKFSKLEKTKEYGQVFFEQAEFLSQIYRISSYVRSVLAIGQYPGISVPAGYNSEGVPFGICFGGLKGSEPKLIEIAYGFETATKVRKPPTFKP